MWLNGRGLIDLCLSISITSFGAPVQNVYLLVIEAQNPISLETNEVPTCVHIIHSVQLSMLIKQGIPLDPPPHPELGHYV